MKAYRLFFLVVLCSLVHTFGWTQLFTFKRYNHRDGLITESTLCSRQDRDGYLWVGSDGGGMMRFDGKRFVEIKHVNQHQPFHVSDIRHGDDGYTYMTTLYDGAFRFKNGKYELIYKPDRKHGDCRSITLIGNRAVVFTSNTIDLIDLKGKLYQSKRLSKSLTQYRQILSTPYFTMVFSDAGNFVINENRIMHLETWLKQQGSSFHPSTANFRKNKLQLIDLEKGKLLELSYSGSGATLRRSFQNLSTTKLKNSEILFADSHGSTTFLTTINHEVYRFQDNKLTYIINNYPSTEMTVRGISVDFNGDLWISANVGLIKVSVEPFTKINLLRIYDDPSILLVYRTKNNKLILGNSKGDLYIGNIFSNAAPVNHHLKAFQVIECTLGTLIATEKGILRLKGDVLEPFKGPELGNTSINFLHWDGKRLWFSRTGLGLSVYDPTNGGTKHYLQEIKGFPNFFYSAQDNFDRTAIYFGTNNGILKWDRQQETFQLLRKFNYLGSYSGSSTKDKFGTLWFTLDRGLVGITRNGENVVIAGKDKLPSTLFYTLSADNFGNLLVGTNRGINVIRVDYEGHVLKHRNYSHAEGFGGYETNMRAIYQNGNISFVGTIEGLYQINSNVLESYPIPPRPLIIRGRELNDGSIQNQSEKNYFTVKCVMSKTSGVLFSYRFLNSDPTWSNYSRLQEIQIPELNNGTYVLQVKASYDGTNASEIASISFVVSEPIWMNKWFIASLIVLIGVINILFVQWNKTLVPSQIVNAQDFGITPTIIPRLIGLALVLNFIIQFLLNFALPETFSIIPLMIIECSVLMVFFILSVVALKKQQAPVILQTLLILTYIVVIIGYFVLIVQTKLHPTPIFGIIISASVSPYIFKSIRWVMLSSVSLILVSVLIALLINDPEFSVLLFIASITIGAAFAVIVAVLRSDSLQKLIFVNALVNKGNVIMISFDNHNIVHYCSSNISTYLPMSADALIGKPLSMLNDIVTSNQMRQIKINDLFADGKTFLVPMNDRNNKVIYIEWSCKYLSTNVQVIMGQDVTDKLTLANNYQALVENAQEIIYTTDIQGNFTFANERAFQVFGYRQETIVGKSSFYQIMPEYREQVEQFYRDQFKNRLHHTYHEFPIRSRDGKTIWISQNVTLQYEPGNKKRISGFLALARDITERRANELLIDQQNKDITESINSAKRIQFNLLPDPSRLKHHFSDSFLLFKPREIVSGDFYWFGEINGKWIMAVADATGHGVPGAFMSILGFQLLNQIICERKVIDADEILKAFRKELAMQLGSKSDSGRGDDLDILIAVKDGNQFRLATSGVGYLICKKDQQHFSNNTSPGSQPEQFACTLESDDLIYLFTDGIYVQQGGLNGNDFGINRFEEFMESIRLDGLALQKKHIENTLRNWSEGYTQNDDITILGMRV